VAQCGPAGVGDGGWGAARVPKAGDDSSTILGNVVDFDRDFSLPAASARAAPTTFSLLLCLR
jgi:hypothetical protein